MDKWEDAQLLCMEAGGNRACKDFMKKHKCFDQPRMSLPVAARLFLSFSQRFQDADVFTISHAQLLKGGPAKAQRSGVKGSRPRLQSD
jgi:hypothetical protein